MEKTQDQCICGWVGEDFEQHHRDTIDDDLMHMEISDLLKKNLI